MKQIASLTLILIYLALFLGSCAGSSAAPTSAAVPETAVSVTVVSDSAVSITPTPVPFTLSSSAFAAQADIPARYTCHGENLSPALQWTTPPADTQSLVLLMDDPDAVPVAGRVWDHWVLFNIPASATSLPESLPKEEQLPDGSQHGRTSSSQLGYSGPCPPSGQTHGYVFTLYALDTILDMESRPTKAAVLTAMEGHILAQAELVGLYTSP